MIAYRCCQKLGKSVIAGLGRANVLSDTFAFDDGLWWVHPLQGRLQKHYPALGYLHENQMHAIVNVIWICRSISATTASADVTAEPYRPPQHLRFHKTPCEK